MPYPLNINCQQPRANKVFHDLMQMDALVFVVGDQRLTGTLGTSIFPKKVSTGI